MDSKTLKRIEQIESILDKHVNTTAQEHSKQLAELRLIIGNCIRNYVPNQTWQTSSPIPIKSPLSK